MYNFSGLIFRIWGVAGIIFIIGVICVLMGQPWRNGFKGSCAEEFANENDIPFEALD